MDCELVRWQELVRRAGTPAKARTWLTDGLWWRVFHDVYAPFATDDTLRLRVAALRVVLPPDVAVSHRTALWLLGLDVLGPAIDVTAPRGRRLEPRSGIAPYSALLRDDELCEVGGLLVVSAARALVDVARSEQLTEAVAVADAALRAGVATQEQIREVLDRSSGLRGVVAARAMLPHLEPRSESLMESRLRMRFVLGGVPRPEAQVDLYDADGHIGRADLHLRGVVVEYDGRQARLDKDVFIRERRRQTRIAESGCELRRFTSADVYLRPAAAVCAELLRAVTQAAGRDRSRLRAGRDTLRPPAQSPLPTLAQARVADEAA
jgi:hypothetical protein